MTEPLKSRSENVRTIIQDPDWWTYNDEAQLNILSHDPKFKHLRETDPETAQQVFNQIKTTYHDQYAPRAPSYEKEMPLSRRAARFAGGVGGAFTAAAIPSVAAGREKFYTVPMGAHVGGMFGDAMWQLGERFGEYVTGQPSRHGYPKTSAEAATDMTGAGFGESLPELIGGQITKAGMKILAPYAKSLVPEIVKAEKKLMRRPYTKKFMETNKLPGQTLITKKKPKRLPFFPIERTSGAATLEFMHEVGASAIWGKGKVVSHAAKRDAEIFEPWVDNLLKSWGPKLSDVEIGELFVKTINKENEITAAAASPVFNELRARAGNLPIPLKHTKDYLRGLNPKPGMVGEDLVKLSQQAKDSGMTSPLMGDDLVLNTNALPNVIDYNFAFRQRQFFRTAKDSLKADPAGKKASGLRIAKRLEQAINQDIGDALKKYDPDLYGLEKAGRRYYKHRKDQYDNIFLRRLMKHADDMGKGPEMIARAIIPPTGGVTTIRRMKAALSTDPKVWRAFQVYGMEYLLRASPDDANVGAISGKKLLNHMFYKKAGFRNILNELFTPRQISAITEVAQALETTQRKRGGGGRMLIQLTQGAMIASLLSGGVAAAALGEGSGVIGNIKEFASSKLSQGGIAILLGPKALSWMMTSPKWSKWLSTGIQLPANSPKAAGHMARLMHFASDIADNIDFYGEGPPATRPQHPEVEQFRDLSEVPMQATGNEADPLQLMQ